MTTQPPQPPATKSSSPSEPAGHQSSAPGLARVPAAEEAGGADVLPVRRALVSVYDKAGLVGLAEALAHAGVEIVSTGSTAATIEGAGLPVTAVEQVTGFPECLDGRVKTLHPSIHAGILADRRRTGHLEQIRDLGIEPVDLVVVNLYPFADTVASGAPYEACVEQIDIGGPAMVRAAAKNHACVAVVTDPADYPAVAEEVAAGGLTASRRRELAAAAFAHTAAYDAAVATWMALQAEQPDRTDQHGGAGQAAHPQGADQRPAASQATGGQVPARRRAPGTLPAYIGTGYRRLSRLRYGENPHQEAALYRAVAEGGGVATARQLHGKAMSYNNYTDTDAALRAAWDHGDQVCVAVVKHANPCGIAVSAVGDVAEAHRRAHACDPVSAYGGVVATNATVTAQMARQVRPVFTEVVAAPAFDEEAVEILRARKNLRLLVVEPPAREGYEVRQISGGAVVQQRDTLAAPGDDPASWTLVAGQPGDDALMDDLVFAWRAVRSVRSNAVLLARGGATVGVGMGQVNRVDSCRLAVERANTLGARSTGDAAQTPGRGDGGDSTRGAPSAAARVADRGASVSTSGDGAQEGAADRAGTVGTVGLPAPRPPERARGAVAASDAFFPFADGLQVLLDAGVRAVVQPGGSVRDQEVIAAARAAGVTMYLTGARHFAH